MSPKASRPGRPVLREIDHTADVGFEIEAASLEDLFGAAADGLVRVLGLSGIRSEPGAKKELVELQRPDLERLLVAWLRELLVRAQVDRSCPRISELAVSAPEERSESGPSRGGDDSGVGLRSRLSWTSADVPMREVKAVTYHGLEVARQGDGWIARVIFDV